MFKPMLCSQMTEGEARAAFALGGWFVEEKYDGVRAFIKDGRLFNRHGRDMTAQFPEFGVLPDRPYVIDGEIVCGESFSDVGARVHTRDPFSIRMLSKQMPALFMAFDVCLSGDWWYRREQLWSVERMMRVEVVNGAPWFCVVQASSEFDVFFAGIRARGGEGVVMKRADGVYVEGVRSRDFVKVKNFLETSAKFVKLEVHAKGVRLETEDGHSVNVNGSDAVGIRQVFGRDGFVWCAVQFMPTESGAWRMPSYRGVVGDPEVVL